MEEAPCKVGLGVGLKEEGDGACGSQGGRKLVLLGPREKGAWFGVLRAEGAMLLV